MFGIELTLFGIWCFITGIMFGIAIALVVSSWRYEK